MTAAPGRPIYRLDRSRGRAVPAIYEQLREAIISSAVEPGATLREADVAAQLGVSRTPVREAIIRLSEERLVTIVPQLGTFVGRIDMQLVRNAQFIRESLEAAALRTVAEREARDTILLRELLEIQQVAVDAGNTARFFEADEALHSAIFDLAGYPRLWDGIRSVRHQMDRLRRLSLPEPAVLHELLAEHRQIVDAVRDGDAGTAESVLREHARRVLRYAPQVRQQYPDYFVPEDLETTAGRA